jgi:predicted ATPase
MGVRCGRNVRATLSARPRNDALVISEARCLSPAAWRVDSVGLVIATLAVENYRSLRRLIVPLAPLTVVTGANGTGKSSLYRALRLLADAARNGAVAALAREGGLPSTLWAGPETIGRAVREGTHPVQGVVRAKSVSLRLGFRRG